MGFIFEYMYVRKNISLSVGAVEPPRPVSLWGFA